MVPTIRPDPCLVRTAKQNRKLPPWNRYQPGAPVQQFQIRGQFWLMISQTGNRLFQFCSVQNRLTFHISFCKGKQAAPQPAWSWAAGPHDIGKVNVGLSNSPILDRWRGESVKFFFIFYILFVIYK